MEKLLIAELTRKTGCSEADARRVVHATLDTLGERMSSDDALALSRALPRDLGDRLLSYGFDPSLVELRTFYQRVARRASLKPTRAAGRAHIVSAKLSELLDDKSRAILARSVWPQLIAPPGPSVVQGHASQPPSASASSRQSRS